ARLGERAKTAVCGETGLLGGSIGGDGAEHLGLTDLLDERLHLFSGPAQPARVSRGEDELLALELEEQALQQLPLAPQYQRELLHRPGPFASCLTRSIGAPPRLLRETRRPGVAPLWDDRIGTKVPAGSTSVH